MDFKTLELMPKMNWDANDLAAEFKKFRNKCNIVFGSVLREEPEHAKIQYFKLFLGDRGLEIFDTLKWNEGIPAVNAVPAVDGRPAVAAQAAIPAEDSVLQLVIEKFKRYVEPRRGEVRATSMFMKRWQKAEEPFDKFVTDLKVLIKDCNFGDHADRMIRDAIAIRSYDAKVREKCLEKDPSLTLEQAIRIGQNMEVAKATLKFIDGDRQVSFIENPIPNIENSKDSNSSNANEASNMCCHSVQSSNTNMCCHAVKNRFQNRGNVSQNRGNVSQKKCQYCARMHLGVCRFKDFKGKCHSCGETGHLKQVCPKNQSTNQDKQSKNQDKQSTNQVYSEYQMYSDPENES